VSVFEVENKMEKSSGGDRRKSIHGTRKERVERVGPLRKIGKMENPSPSDQRVRSEKPEEGKRLRGQGV